MWSRKRPTAVAVVGKLHDPAEGSCSPHYITTLPKGSWLAPGNPCHISRANGLKFAGDMNELLRPKMSGDS